MGGWGDGGMGGWGWGELWVDACLRVWDGGDAPQMSCNKIYDLQPPCSVRACMSPFCILQHIVCVNVSNL